MPGLHSHRDSMRQDENESMKVTFVSSSTLSTCSRLVSSCLKALGDVLVNQSRVKGNENVSNVLPRYRRYCGYILTRVWMSIFVRTLSRSHLVKSLDEYPKWECKPGIIISLKFPCPLITINSKLVKFSWIFFHNVYSKIFINFTNQTKNLHWLFYEFFKNFQYSQIFFKTFKRLNKIFLNF